MSIQNELDKIKNSVYGREVRGAIHDGIKKAYDDASEKDNANMEVKMARGKFDTLDHRLDNQDAMKATKVELGNVSDAKVDKGGNEQVTWSMLSQEAKENVTGGNTPVVGENSVNTSNIVDGAVSSQKVSPELLQAHHVASAGGEPLNYLSKTRSFQIPSGFALYVGGKNFVNEHDLTIAQEGSSSTNALLFNVKTKLYRLVSIYINEQSEDELVVAVVRHYPNWPIGRIQISSTGSVLLDGAHRHEHRQGPTMIPPYTWRENKKLPNYNTAKNELTIYRNTTILYGDDTYYEVPNDLTVENNEASSQVRLIFNPSTKTFRVIPWNIPFGATELLLATIRRPQTENAVYSSGPFDFSVDGRHPLYGNVNIGGSEPPASAVVDALHNELVSTRDKNTISFAFITDTHSHDLKITSPDQPSKVKAYREYELLQYLGAKGSVDFIAHGGDIAHGMDSLSETRGQFDQTVKLLSKMKTPFLPMFGNHDDNSYHTTSPTTSHVMPKAELTQRVIKPFYNGANHDSKNNLSGYYYKDIKDKKTRMVVLDALDYPVIVDEGDKLRYHGRNYWGYGIEQANWLANEALKDIPTGYKVVVLSHMVFNNDHSESSTNGTYPKNGELIEGVLHAFVDGTDYVGETANADYGGSVSASFDTPGKILAYIHGHEHLDTVHNSGGKFPVIGTINSYTDVEEHDYTYGAWDIFVINTVTNNIQIKRVGYGEDRVIT